ncbi:MAG: CehA/McbA family metallohydrolase [Spirochaetales bacterium]|nr:CehA/McbA family metallohydrolase [Spirochaetales bacterium]
MHVFSENSTRLNDIWKTNRQYPSITIGPDDKNYIVSVESKRHSDEVILSILDGKNVIEEKKISGEGLAFRPVVESIGDEIFFAWSEYSEDEWKMMMRSMKNGVLSSSVVVDSGEALFYPSFVKMADKPILLYSRQGKGFSETVAYDGEEKRVVSTIKKAYRPSGVMIDDGYVVVYDAFNGESYDVMARVVKGEKLGEEVRINSRQYRCAEAVVTKCGDDVVVCWYENGPLSYFAYLSRDLKVNGTEIEAKKEMVHVENRNWYNNVSVASNGDNLVFAYTIGKNNIVGRVRHSDGTWSKGCCLTFDDGMCAVRPSLSLDKKGNLRYAWQFAMMNGHQIRNAVIIYNEVTIDEIEKYDDTEKENHIDKFVQPILMEKDLSGVDEGKKKAWLRKNNISSNLLFGDIHGQSNMSDGMGEVDQYYHYAMIDSQMDFCALTDHDSYPDEATDAEWEFNRAQRNNINEDNGLIALLAFEWTPNEYMHDFGHKNVYYPSREGKLFTSIDPSGMNPDRLYESIKKAGAICIPHHPAADWGRVSAATDWSYHDEEVEPLMEIYSRHADYEAYGNTSKYTKNIAKFEKKCARDALERGYHLGFTAGSDSHQMEHGKEGGIVAVFAEERTSEGVWSALKNRHTYGTTGARILLNFTLNGLNMGSITSGEERNIKVSGIGVTEVEGVDIIKNGRVIYTFIPSSLEFDFEFKDTKEKEEDYYYVKVRQKDEQRAWSSPIWVK